MSVNSKMTAIANEIRELSGTETTKTLDDMATYVREANDEINEQSEIINQIFTAIDELPELACPTISIDSNGLITAEVGNYISTHQLAFQEAKTITPSLTDIIAVSSGYYTGDNVIVKGDSNLVDENIKNGVSIFGVVGTLSGGSEDEDTIIARTISGDYSNDRTTNIGSYAFAYCSSLTSVSFPICTSIGYGAFSDCSNLKSANFPACASIGSYAFAYCTSLTSAYFPVCTNIGNSVFSSCSNLKSVNFPACTSIGGYAFAYCTNLSVAMFSVCRYIYSNVFSKCYNLSRLYLKSSSVCTLGYSNAFKSTPYAGYSASFSGTPYIYVPASLVSAYKSATNWTYFSKYFRSI